MRSKYFSINGTSVSLLQILVLCLCVCCFAQPVLAGVVASGDVDPDDPSTWTSSTYVYIGMSSSGTLDVTGGGGVTTSSGIIGYSYGSLGEVTVDGIGSIWENSSNLGVGFYGSGILNITGGGTVAVEGSTMVAWGTYSSGKINFDNGTLTTGDLYCVTSDLTGTGTINTSGLISDVDLVFDAEHGLNQTLSINENVGQNITVNLNIDGSGSIGAGYSSAGSMTISDGVDIASTYGRIGYNYGSTGAVTVDGVGSTWTTSEPLFVGIYGSGTLDITGGGMVNNQAGYIGHFSSSTGVVKVDGNGSMWTMGSMTPNTGGFTVGFDGNGTLNITSGGRVSNTGAYVGLKSGSTGTVTVDGTGSTWTNSGNLYVGYNGSGTIDITDGGLVRAYSLTIDLDRDGDSFVNMAGGGMLALRGEADGSLVEFLGLVGGTDAIRYWDASVLDWADITGATFGDDYMLDYIADGGDLDGYTVLTVNTVPEPCSLVLLGLGGLVLRRRRG